MKNVFCKIIHDIGATEFEERTFSDEVYKKHTKKCFSPLCVKQYCSSWFGSSRLEYLYVVDLKPSDDPYCRYEEICRGCGNRSFTNRGESSKYNSP